MKKIAIIINSFSMGGIPKACITFMNQLSAYYNVTLFLDNDKEELCNQIPNNVQIKKIKTKQVKEIIKKIIWKRKYGRLICFVFLYILNTKVINRWVKTNELVSKTCEQISDTYYDCAIAYHGMNIGTLVTTIYNINAKKKIAWIHGNHPFIGIHKKDVSNIYDKFDKIFCVSPSVCKRFINDFPNTFKIVESYKNRLDSISIKNLSNEYPLNFNKEYINIVTVGRISKEKGQEMIPEITRILIDSGFNIKWYLVGDGPDKERIEALMKQYNVNNNIVFVGNKLNPYPYMKECDIYIQPSYSEGYCLTVCEAAILQKPIVLTKIAAENILEDGENAIVVDANATSVAEGIQKLINNQDLKNKFIKNLKKQDFSNQNEIQKLIEFLN